MLGSRGTISRSIHPAGVIAPVASPWYRAAHVLRAPRVVLTCLCGVLVATSGGCNLDEQLNADSTSAADGASSTAATPSGDGADETGQRTAACDGRQVRVGTYNIESVDPVGSGSFAAVADTLSRIAPDIVCVQEIVDGEGVAFVELAGAAGYPYAVKADRSPPIGGELSNGCMARFPLEVIGSWGGAELSSDLNANDVGRDFLAVRMDLSEGLPADDACHLGVITVHAKSGQQPSDGFRRQVEAVRLTQAVARYREAYPDDAMVVLGDFNETLDDSALGSVFETAPAELPSSYRLGADILFPLTYQPFERLSEAGFELTSPAQEDAPDSRETWRDAARLDYVWLSGAEWIAGEVYNACRDNGVDDAPPGNNVDKSGEPLECSASALASDHFAVLADIRLP